MRLIDADDLLNSIYADNPRDIMDYIANFPEANEAQFICPMGWCPLDKEDSDE